jgi:hypothetical protein
MALGHILSQSLSRNEHFTAPAKHSPMPLSKNLNRLVCAAVVNPGFQGLLLSDPVAALAAGYNGENFQLTPAEYKAVTSLRVRTVNDFAAQLLNMLQHASADDTHYLREAQADFRYAEVATQ